MGYCKRSKKCQHYDEVIDNKAILPNSKQDCKKGYKGKMHRYCSNGYIKEDTSKCQRTTQCNNHGTYVNKGETYYGAQSCKIRGTNKWGSIDKTCGNNNEFTKVTECKAKPKDVCYAEGKKINNGQENKNIKKKCHQGY